MPAAATSRPPETGTAAVGFSNFVKVAEIKESYQS